MGLVLFGGVNSGWVHAQQQPLSAIAASWEGIPTDFTLEPPDPHGSAGPNGVLQVVNVRIEYWTKAGTKIWGPTLFERFFPWATGAFQSDPRALYDPVAHRFYVEILEIDFSGKHSYIDLAVSKGPNPASDSATDWDFYRIENTRTVSGVDYWGDYSAFGFDSRALYVSLNLYGFTSGVNDAQLTVIDKAKLLTGVTNYSFIYIPGGPLAAFTLQPCTIVGSSNPGNVAFFGEAFPGNSSPTQVRVWALQDPLGAQTLTSAMVPIPDNGGPPTDFAPQPGRPASIDPLDGRTQGNAFWYNGAVWFCHTAGGDTGRTLVYYYKVNLGGFPTSGSPTLGESGSVGAGPGMWTYQPSIGGNGKGDVCMVFTGSSTTTNPTIFFTVHSACATNFDAASILKVSPTAYRGGRWGDFASVSVDPTDDSFWVTHEFARGANPGAWGTWWGHILVGTAPAIVSQPSSQTAFQGDTVSFSVGVSGNTPCSPLTFQWFFNSAPLAGATTSTLTLTNVTLSQAGIYTVGITNTAGTASSSNAFLTIIPVVPLPVALNATSLVWTTSGDGRWHGLTGTTHDGIAAGQSGAVADNQMSRLSTTVSGPGTLSFWWKVSSQTNSDYLNFYANGVLQAAISGNVDWQQKTFYLAAGTQTLEWVYKKDVIGNAGQDLGWVDQVSYSSGGTGALIVSAPTDQVVTAGDPASFSVIAAGTPPLQYQWQFNGVDISGATDATYSIAQTSLGDAGEYSVRVANDFGGLTSPNAHLSVGLLSIWGNNDFNQGVTIPGLSNLVTIAAGGFHTLALRADGEVLAWGDNFDGQCDVPQGLNNVVGIAGGGYHSLAVRANGRVAAWGSPYDGQIAVPAEAKDVVAVSAGTWHSLALRADGTVVAWGDNSLGQGTVPAEATNIVAIAAGGQHSLALRGDGKVIAWGNNLGQDGLHAGQVDVPWDLENVVAIAAGDAHSLALKSDGTVVAWGDNSEGQASVPERLFPAVFVAGGGAHSLGVQQGGKVVAWGDNLFNQSVVGSLGKVSMVAAGTYHSVALLGQIPSGPSLINPRRDGDAFSVDIPTIAGKAYFLEFRTSITSGSWQPASSGIVGDGSVRTISEQSVGPGIRFYRVRMQ